MHGQDLRTGQVKNFAALKNALVIVATGIIWQKQPFPWSEYEGKEPVATVPYRPQKDDVQEAADWVDWDGLSGQVQGELPKARIHP